MNPGRKQWDSTDKIIIFAANLQAMDESSYYGIFENNLRDELIRVCTLALCLDGNLLRSDDIDQKWKELAPDYMADAMKVISDYPTVSLAWAGYVGMAIAKWWDQDWSTFGAWPYAKLLGKRGFDDMDEHIIRDIVGLKLESEEANKIEEILRQCATTAIGFIRHENIEPMSIRAFHIYARSVKVLYEIGAAIMLKRLGYKWKSVL